MMANWQKTTYKRKPALKLVDDKGKTLWVVHKLELSLDLSEYGKHQEVFWHAENAKGGDMLLRTLGIFAGWTQEGETFVSANKKDCPPECENGNVVYAKYRAEEDMKRHCEVLLRAMAC